MVAKGVVPPVSEPIDWCAPIVVVPKTNKKVRTCVDYTKLNKAICREVHPIAHIESTLAKLRNSTIFTALSANYGFYQIPLKQKC